MAARNSNRTARPRPASYERYNLYLCIWYLLQNVGFFIITHFKRWKKKKMISLQRNTILSRLINRRNRLCDGGMSWIVVQNCIAAIRRVLYLNR